jgi:hypothetical protein
MLACHLRDGAAESEFFAWLEEELANPKGNHSHSHSHFVPLPVSLSPSYPYLILPPFLPLSLSPSLPLPPLSLHFENQFLSESCTRVSI